jgi:hypothetical protein
MVSKESLTPSPPARITATERSAVCSAAMFINSVSLRAALSLPRQNVPCLEKVLVGCPS